MPLGSEGSTMPFLEGWKRAAKSRHTSTAARLISWACLMPEVTCSWTASAKSVTVLVPAIAGSPVECCGQYAKHTKQPLCVSMCAEESPVDLDQRLLLLGAQPGVE